MYSALKKDGQPLYKMARKGQSLDLPARDMTVHSLQAERIADDLVHLDVHCSSGFYIRSLAHDLGQVLGCGAHVVELRRTHIKLIDVKEAHSLASIVALENNPEALAELLLPIDSLIADMPSVELSQGQVDSLLCGKATPAQGIETDGLTRFYSPEKRLFALGQTLANGQLKTQKIFVDLK